MADYKVTPQDTRDVLEIHQEVQLKAKAECINIDTTLGSINNLTEIINYVGDEWVGADPAPLSLTKRDYLSRRFFERTVLKQQYQQIPLPAKHKPKFKYELVSVQPMSLPSSLLFYMDYSFTKISIPKINGPVFGPIADLWSPKPEIDLSKFPHKCPRCSKAAYIGFASIECSEGCKF